MRYRIISVLLWAVVCVDVLGAIPGADDPEVYCDVQYRQELLEFNRRTLGGAYRQVGRTDPEWDDQAIELLDLMAISFTNAQATALSQVSGGKNNKQMLDLSTDVIGRGCDDPLVLYVHATLLEENGKDAEALPLLEQAARGLADSRYPYFRAWRALARLWKSGWGKFPNNDVPAAAIQKMQETEGRLGVGDHLNGVGRRVVWQLVQDAYGDLTDRQENLRRQLEQQAGADPWLKHMTAGKLHIKAAWESRGSGWARDVKPEGWKGFHEHLAAAAADFRAARDLHPELPEAAEQMITVAMGAGDELGITPREWFEDAVRAQLDYPPAYHTYGYTLTPRWGGSYEEMLAFARECLEEARYDTNLPWQYFRVLQQMTSDGNGHAHWRWPGVYEEAAQALDRLAEAAAANRPGTRDWYKTYKLGLMVKVGRYEDARAQADELADGHVVRDALGYWELDDEWRGRVYAMSGRHGAAMREVEALLKAREYAQVAARLTALAADPSGEKDADDLIRAKAAEYTWRAKAAESDDWVPAISTGGVNLWRATRGSVSIEKDGTLVGTARERQQWVQAMIRPQLGTSYAVRGAVATHGRTIAGLIVHRQKNDEYEIWINPAKNEVSISHNRHDPQDRTISMGREPSFELKVDADELSLSVDGKEVWSGYQLAGSEYTRVAMVGYNVDGNPHVMFRDVQVRVGGQ